MASKKEWFLKTEKQKQNQKKKKEKRKGTMLITKRLWTKLCKIQEGQRDFYFFFSFRYPRVSGLAYMHLD